jgi:arginine decarboxylase
LPSLARNRVVVLAREATQEPNRLLFASVGLARPKNRKQYGYISEHHGFGQTHKQASDFAEDLAATMLASTLGIELDPDKDWNERKMVYQVGERQFVSRRPPKPHAATKTVFGQR